MTKQLHLKTKKTKSTRTSRKRPSLNWEGRFRDLLENAHLIAIMLDIEGCITFCNPYLLELTGWEEREIMGRSWFDVFIPPEEREEVFALFKSGVREENFPTHHKSAILTRTGKRRMVLWNNTVLRDPDGTITGCASIGEDITDELALEEQYRQAQKLESVGRLAGGIAHDFNNLLTVINGYTDLILSKAGESGPFGDSLMQIRKAGERASTLTRQLLSFSRSQPANLQSIDLNQVITDEVNMLRRLVGEDVDLSISSSAEFATIIADPGQIHQILLNLAVNARDAMPGGGRLTIDVSSAGSASVHAANAVRTMPASGPRPKQYVVLTVSDTGIGMSEEVRARAFDPFFTTKPAGQGTGLGLSTVYGIVRQSGGWISIQSEPGSGTAFRIGFPQVGVPVPAAPASAKHSIVKGSETILIVEDQDEVRQFAAAALRKYGYDVLEATSAGDAILIAETHQGPIQLLLTDIVMPRITGTELVRRIAPLRPDLRVLYMSGYPGDAIAERGVLDMNPRISKPFTPERLGQTVRSLLDEPAAPK